MKRRTAASLPTPRPKRQATPAARASFSLSSATSTITPTSTTVATTTSSVSVSQSTTVPVITPLQARYLRILNAGLINPPIHTNLSSAAQTIASSLVGVQAQEPTSGFLSIFKRIPQSLGGASKPLSPPPTPSPSPPPLTLTTLQSLLTATPPTLIRIWGQRGTLHLYNPSDWPSISTTISPSISASRTTSVKSGNVTGSNSVAALNKCITRAKSMLSEGERVTRRLMESLGYDGRLFYSVSMILTLEGVAMRVDPSEGGESILAPRVSEWKGIERDVALKSMAERYFQSYGPASEADFRYYLALPASQTKPVVSELVEEGVIVPVVIEGTAEDEVKGDEDVEEGTPDTTSKPKGKSKPKPKQITYIHRTHLPVLNSLPATATIPPLLLPRFDPVLLAHSDKSIWITPQYKPSVWTKNGIILGTVLVHGLIAGKWKYTRDGKGKIAVLVEAFGEEFEEHVRGEVVGQMEEYARFLEVEVGEVSWEVIG